MDQEEKAAVPCYDNQLLLEFARGKANAWKRLQEKALSGWRPENSEELERYAFRKRMEAEEEMQEIIEDLRICSTAENKQKERGKKNNMEAKGKKKYILTHKRGAGDGCPNDCGYLADPRLSFSAKGILACILAHPEWPELTADWLASQNRDDVSIIEEDLRLLEQAGYIVASKEN